MPPGFCMLLSAFLALLTLLTLPMGGQRSLSKGFGLLLRSAVECSVLDSFKKCRYATRLLNNSPVAVQTARSFMVLQES